MIYTWNLLRAKTLKVRNGEGFKVGLDSGFPLSMKVKVN